VQREGISFEVRGGLPLQAFSVTVLLLWNWGYAALWHTTSAATLPR
jgi:hypothetical protein